MVPSSPSTSIAWIVALRRVDRSEAGGIVGIHRAQLVAIVAFHRVDAKASSEIVAFIARPSFSIAWLAPASSLCVAQPLAERAASESAWGVVLLALTFFDRSIDGKPLDKRMPMVDGPIAFLRRLAGKRADRDRDGDGGQA